MNYTELKISYQPSFKICSLSSRSQPKPSVTSATTTSYR